MAFLLAVIAFSSGTLALGDDAADQFNLGIGLYRSERWELAAETLQKFLKEHPQHERAGYAQLYLGLALSSLERYEDARPHFEEYLKNDPDSPQSSDARYRLGECNYHLKNYEPALKQFNQFLELHPQHTLASWARLFVADIHNAKREWVEAEKVLRDLIAQPSATAIRRDAQFALGRAYEGQERFADAIQVFSEVAGDATAALAPRAMARIGTIQFGQQNYIEASKSYDSIVSQFAGSPLNDSARLNSGIALFYVQMYDAAIDRLQQVRRDGPNGTQALFMMARALKESGQPDEARKTFAEAAAASANSPLAVDILISLAEFERSEKQLETAARLFEDLVERWPKDRSAARCLMNAADLRLELNQPALAERDLMRLKAEYSQNSASPDFQILEGRVRLARSAAEEALPLFRNAMNATSTDPADAGFRTHLVARYYVAQALSSMKMDADVVDVVKPIVNHLRKPEFQSLAGILVQAAISSLQLENFEDTKALADVFLEVSGDSARRADATAARCVALAGLREFAASRKDADFLIEHHKNESRTWIAVLRAAEQASQQKAFAEAAAFFRLAAANTTDSEVRQAGLSGIAWSLFYSKDFSNAEKAFGAFAAAVQERPEFAQAIYMQAQCVEDAGELDRAATMYESVFQRLTENQSPASAEAETRPPLLYAFNAGQESARIYGEFRNLQKANACWESLVMQFPLAASLDRVLNEWAYLNAMEEQYTTADKIYRKLLDRFPRSPYAGHARLSLAESELVAGRRDVARAEFEAVLANPDYGKTEHENALYQLCVILETEFNWADARVKTEQFLMSFPESQYAPLIKLINAESFKRNGAGLSDIQAAQQTLTALRADLVSGSIPEAPWTDRVWIVSAEAAFAAKDYAVIDTIADELTTHRPESPFLFQVRAIQGRRWKTQAPPDFEKAREYFEMVLKDPVGRKTETAAQCQFLLADTYFLQGNFTEARVQYYAVQFNHADYRDWHEQALHQVARCDLELKEVEKARKTLERFVQDYPNSPLMDEVKKTLASLPE